VCVVGVYPDCELCGLCYDSVASRIDNLAADVEQFYLRTVDVWSHYYRQYSTQSNQINYLTPLEF